MENRGSDTRKSSIITAFSKDHVFDKGFIYQSKADAELPTNKDILYEKGFMRSPKTFRKVGTALPKSDDDPTKNLALKELLKSKGVR